MRVPVVLSILSLAFAAACSSSPGTPEPPPLIEKPASQVGLQIKTPVWTLQPGEERTMCLYTSLPGVGELHFNSYEMAMRPGSHHFLIYRDVSDLTGGNGVAWKDGFRDCDMEQALPINGSQSEYELVNLPTGVGSKLTGGDKVILESHYINYTDEPMIAQAFFNAFYVDPAHINHLAGSFITYTNNFSVPAGAGIDGAPLHRVETVCDVPDVSSVFPDGVRFFSLSSHMHWHGREFNAWTHDLALGTDIEHVYTNDEWADPYTIRFDDADPLIVSNTTGFRYECSYYNDTGGVVSEGPSADDEMCMLVGGYYPVVDGPLNLGGIAFCLDGDLYY